MIFARHIKINVFISVILLTLNSGYVLCKSDFSAAYQVDDQIITNYDMDQIRKLRNLF